ncbi:hypothetical protein E0504_29370 [Parafrankia sp. BMG5.11]|nr:hypothetical protein E0504_29370 [Parafrankia sp. BMG5.11]
MAVSGAACGKSETADCSQYRQESGIGDSGSAYPLTVIGLDLHTNDSSTADEIAQTLTPVIGDALTRGAYIKVIAHGGDGLGTISSDCFTGPAGGPFLIDKKNERREESERSKATDVLTKEAAEFVRSQQVSDTGTATFLIAELKQYIDEARAAASNHLGEVTVILYSNLLGKSDAGQPDCLNIDGQEAGMATAAALVERCFHDGYIDQLAADHVRLAGVGDGAENSQQIILANQLAESLCARWGNCEKPEVDK